MIATVMMTALVGMSSHTQPWTAPALPKAIAVADAQWPASPCRGREVVKFITGAEIVSETGAEGAIGDSTLDGSCVVHISRQGVWDGTWEDCDTGECTGGKMDIKWRYAYLCTAIEHEFGHLAGFGHSLNPNSVMSASPSTTRVCKVAFNAA